MVVLNTGGAVHAFALTNSIAPCIPPGRGYLCNGAKMLCYLAARSPEADLGGSGMDLGWISGYVSRVR